jgi:hypothetical protein
LCTLLVIYIASSWRAAIMLKNIRSEVVNVK